MNKRSIFLGIALALLCFSGGWISHKRITRPVISTQTDTVYIEKSVTFDSPAETSASPAPPVLVPRGSVLPTADSSVVAVQAETKTYRDTTDGAAIEVIVSGVQPKLESASVRYLSPQVTTTRTVYQPYEGWKMSLKQDAATLSSPEFTVLGYTALEFSYSKSVFHFHIDAGCSETYTSGARWKFAPYVGAGIKVDICRLSSR